MWYASGIADAVKVSKIPLKDLRLLLCSVIITAIPILDQVSGISWRSFSSKSNCADISGTGDNSADGGCLGMSNQYETTKVACPNGCGRWLYPLEKDCCKRRCNCPALPPRPVGVSWRRNGSSNNVMIKLNDHGNNQGHSHSYLHHHHQHHHRLTTQSSNL